MFIWVAVYRYTRTYTVVLDAISNSIVTAAAIDEVFYAVIVLYEVILTYIFS